MRVVLLLLLLWVVFFNSAYAKVDSNSAAKPVDATSPEEARVIPATKKWYAGGAIGLSYLTGWDDSNAAYGSYGYFERSHPETLFLWDISKHLYEKMSWEGKIYGGYRLQNYLDIEMGYTRDDNWTPTVDYKNSSTGDTIKSSRRVHAQAMYASISLRPISEGRGHGLYFKLGGHSSELKISKTVTGTPANLNTIAAADNLPGDGVSRGYGTLYGLGFDFKTAKYGAVRLEWSHFNKLGGTSYGKSSVNIGFHGDF